jgi:hypothetical protein
MVLAVMLNGLERMKKEGVERAVLSVEDLPEASPEGTVILERPNFPYVFEALTDAEQVRILRKEDYGTVALVADIGNDTFENDFIELHYRQRGIVLLPLKPESPLHYATGINNFVGGDRIKEFSGYAVNQKCTREEMQEMIEKGITDYHARTRALMEKAGVYDALRRMDERGVSSFEEVLLKEAV